MNAPDKDTSPVIKATIISLDIVNTPFLLFIFILSYLIDFVKKKCYNNIRKERDFMAEFYDGTKLLSMNDINGRQPDIFLTSGNRSIGKTTWFNRYCVKDFIKKHKKFCLVYRWNYELSDCADKFFKDITNTKDLAWLYIDDRSLCFQGNYSLLSNQIKNFRPWYK